MNTLFLRAVVGSVALVAVAGVGNAADLARRAPVATPIETPVSAYNWTGLYAGAHLGGDFVRNSVKGAGDADSSTVFGGLTAGYNYQTGPWVFGAEGDIGYGKATKTKTISGVGTLKSEKDWGGTARLRAGYAIDNLLVYGTGGLAVGSFHSKLNTTTSSTSKDSTKAGWTLGGGLEYAVAKNISVKGEYLYADYGRENVGGVRQNLSEHLARVGVNYKF